MTKINLFSIKQLADKKEQKKGLLAFVNFNFPELNIKKIKINSNAVSLNSLNGFLKTQNGLEFFFKFHTEEGETLTMDEYYNSQVLLEAGFPCLKPIAKKTDPGSQFVIYPKIEEQTLFTLWGKAEKSQNKIALNKLLTLEKKFCQKISRLQLQSLTPKTSLEIKKQPIQQLFYNRLVNLKTIPRLDLFYKDKVSKFPDGEKITSQQLFDLKFEINGQKYDKTLNEMIKEAKKLLDPENSSSFCVTAHGDDHNGNKFLINNKVVYFDPAFAGNAIPALLANIKTTFHDSLAHPYWLYDPKYAAQIYQCSYQLKGGKIIINHNYSPSLNRLKLLEIKARYLWQPLIQKLKTEKSLPLNFENYLRKAFFCCPFLVKNLIDYKTISPAISLISLCNCLELGAKSNRPNILDQYFFQYL